VSKSSKTLNLDEVATVLNDHVSEGYGSTTSVVVYVEGERFLVTRVTHAVFFDSTGVEREVALEVRLP
jgi:hypothetical protein